MTFDPEFNRLVDQAIERLGPEQVARIREAAAAAFDNSDNVDLRLMAFLAPRFDSGSSFVATGLVLGLRIATRYPEWAVGFLNQSKVPDTAPIEELVEAIPIEVRDD